MTNQEKQLSAPKKITGLHNEFRFTVATLVTDWEEYTQMVNSIREAGFTPDVCEFVYIDNIKENSFDGYQGINLLLQSAKGEFVIIVHQDVLFNFDMVGVLNKRIEQITKLDKNWAVLSNAGGIENNLYNRIAVHVAYADGRVQKETKLPQKVCSVDEHFIVVKRSANLALSHNLKGFHFYGTDICLVAELLGFTAYVVDFKITHKSYGRLNESYYTILRQLIAKYVMFMRSRTIVTTIADFRLSPSGINTFVFNSKFGKKVYRKIKKIKDPEPKLGNAKTNGLN